MVLPIQWESKIKKSIMVIFLVLLIFVIKAQDLTSRISKKVANEEEATERSTFMTFKYIVIGPSIFDEQTWNWMTKEEHGLAKRWWVKTLIVQKVEIGVSSGGRRWGRWF